jgi:hypothetical protein
LQLERCARRRAARPMGRPLPGSRWEPGTMNGAPRRGTRYPLTPVRSNTANEGSLAATLRSRDHVCVKGHGAPQTPATARSERRMGGLTTIVNPAGDQRPGVDRAVLSVLRHISRAPYARDCALRPRLKCAVKFAPILLTTLGFRPPQSRPWVNNDNLPRWCPWSQATVDSRRGHPRISGDRRRVLSRSGARC